MTTQWKLKWILTMMAISAIRSLAFGQNIGINDTGVAPNPFALLDISSTTNDKGLLIPRLSTADRMAIAGLGATEDGLLVYDTTTRSFWHWDGALLQWVQLGTGGGSGWALTGNAGTVAGTNFLGTTDNQALEIWTDSLPRTRITTKGQIEVLNTGESVFVGENAGANDDLTGNQNVFVGKDAGNQNTSGGCNTAVGYYALRENTSSWYNTAVGHGALRQNTTGSSNTAIGFGSLVVNTTGTYNTALGNGAMSSETTGWQNTAVGSGAMERTTIGDNNSAIGGWSLRYNEIGNANTAHGALSLHSNVAGSNATAIGALAMRYANNTATPFVNTNVAVGYSALMGSGTPAANVGLDNTAVGYAAMASNANGYANTALGYQALYGNVGGFPWQGQSNTGVGYRALFSNSIGGGNTAIGRTALQSNTSGGGNVAVGVVALTANTIGESNTAIGAGAMSTSMLGSWNTAVGANALGNSPVGLFNAAFGTQALMYNSGNENTAIGANALRNNLVGGGNVALGSEAGENEMGSDRLYIDNSNTVTPLIYGEFDNDFVRINNNLGIGSSWFGGGTKVLSFEVGVPPAPDPAHAMLFAEVQAGTTELRTMDGAGNTSTISPHNFSLAPRSEPMAWSFYSENRALDRRVNVDMMRLTRLVERMSGEQLVHMTDMAGTVIEPIASEGPGLAARLVDLETQLRAALQRITELERAIEDQRTRNP